MPGTTRDIGPTLEGITPSKHLLFLHQLAILQCKSCGGRWGKLLFTPCSYKISRCLAQAAWESESGLCWLQFRSRCLC